jgi:signal transduction histidine kinase
VTPADVAGAPERLTPDEVRSLFLFESLDDEKLAWLAEHGRIERRAAGEAVYTEGEPATHFYVVLDGTIALSRRVRGDDVEVNRTDMRGVYGGATQAYVRDAGPQNYLNSMRAVTDVRVFVLTAEEFAVVIRTWFPMAIHLLEGLYFGLQNTQAITGQREYILALGEQTARLAHELNNPAAAAMRAAASLRTHVEGMRNKLATLASGDLDLASLSTLVGLQHRIIEMRGGRRKLSPREESEREDEIGEWLDERRVPSGWDVAPIFAEGGIDIACLREVERSVSPELLGSAIHWLANTVETEQVMDEIDDALRRISGLVAAARQYSQMDRAPEQVVDIRELLDSTLAMLAGKIPPGVRVVRDYADDLPSIVAYGAELNQVWTNLVQNALDAMGAEGTLTVRTALDDGCLVVEIADTGVGIPPELQRRIFEPFFTTKPVGEGMGVGLDISWRTVVNRHHGSISVESVPGDTRFVVRLPLERGPVPTLRPGEAGGAGAAGAENAAGAGGAAQ